MSLTLSRVLHAGYVFSSGNTQIIFDPIFENPFSQNCYAYPSVNFNHDAIRELNFAAVFISHFHDDHCSLESLNLVNRATPIYIYCKHDEIIGLIRELGFHNVKTLALDIPETIGPITVTPLHALDDDVDAIYAIECDGLKVLNVVDSWIDPAVMPHLAEKAPWNVVLWPFQTMRELAVLSPSRAEGADGSLPSEWVAQIAALRPKFLIPSSCQFQHEGWSWLNHALFPITYRGFTRQIEKALPETKVIRLDPSMSVQVEENSLSFLKPIPWIDRIGPQSVDYDYRADLKVPLTSEVAKHFRPLSTAQSERVAAFAQTEVLERLAKLPPDSDYFSKPRRWRLSIFDNEGHGKHFDYEISATAAKSLAYDPKAPIDWLTEVPAPRLYGALEDGETMTSMYLRINDQRFSDGVEAALKDVDILEDPLVRALFNGGDVAGYQRAQLKRITKT